MKVILRSATYNDIDELHKMFKRIAKEHSDYIGGSVMSVIKKISGTPEDAPPTQYVKDLIDSKAHNVWVLTDGLDILAMVHFSKIKSMIVPDATDMYIMYLVSNVEKKGYASMLINAVKTVASKRQCYGVMLDVVTKNDNALKLYIKQGFQVIKSSDVSTKMYCKV